LTSGSSNSCVVQVPDYDVYTLFRGVVGEIQNYDVITIGIIRDYKNRPNEPVLACQPHAGRPRGGVHV